MKKKFVLNINYPTQGVLQSYTKKNTKKWTQDTFSQLTKWIFWLKLFPLVLLSLIHLQSFSIHNSTILIFKKFFEKFIFKLQTNDSLNEFNFNSLKFVSLYISSLVIFFISTSSSYSLKHWNSIWLIWFNTIIALTH